MEDLNTPPVSTTVNHRTGYGDQEKQRFQDPRNTGDKGSIKSDGSKTLTSPHDPFEGMKHSKKHKVNLEVYNAFIGYPKRHDPFHVQLGSKAWLWPKECSIHKRLIDGNQGS